MSVSYVKEVGFKDEARIAIGLTGGIVLKKIPPALGGVGGRGFVILVTLPPKRGGNIWVRVLKDVS